MNIFGSIRIGGANPPLIPQRNIEAIQDNGWELINRIMITAARAIGLVSTLFFSVMALSTGDPLAVVAAVGCGLATAGLFCIGDDNPCDAIADALNIIGIVESPRMVSIRRRPLHPFVPQSRQQDNRSMDGYTVTPFTQSLHNVFGDLPQRDLVRQRNPVTVNMFRHNSQNNPHLPNRETVGQRDHVNQPPVNHNPPVNNLPNRDQVTHREQERDQRPNHLPNREPVGHRDNLNQLPVHNNPLPNRDPVNQRAPVNHQQNDPYRRDNIGDRN